MTRSISLSSSPHPFFDREIWILIRGFVPLGIFVYYILHCVLAQYITFFLFKNSIEISISLMKLEGHALNIDCCSGDSFFEIWLSSPT